MKKNIFYLLIAFLFLAVACQEEEKVEFYDLGSEFFVTINSYTSLDDEVTLTIENQQKNLSNIAITHLGGLTTTEDADGDLVPYTSTYTGSIAITDGEGAITLTDVQLGMTTIGWTANLQFDAEIDGKPFTRKKTITVKDPISVVNPGITHRSDTTYYFTFVIAPKVATVETVTVETKVSALGTYAALAGPFEAEDSIAILGVDYDLNDTLFVKVTGTVGTKTATKTTKITFIPDSYENVNAFVLDTTANLAIDLIENRYVENTIEYGDSADIYMYAYYTPGGLLLGFDSDNNAEFVPATAADYANADIYFIENTDFTTASSWFEDFEEGDVFIYRTYRGTDDYSYGIFKITKVDKPQGVLEDSYFEIEVKN